MAGPRRERTRSHIRVPLQRPSSGARETMAPIAFRPVVTLPFARLMKASPAPVADLTAGRYEPLAAGRRSRSRTRPATAPR